MNAVIDEVSRVLTARGVKIDPTIEAAIRAFAEKEVAKMNADKTDQTTTDTPATVENYDPDTVTDLTQVPKAAAKDGADTNA
jgi:hypothetical protein